MLRRVDDSHVPYCHTIFLQIVAESCGLVVVVFLPTPGRIYCSTKQKSINQLQGQYILYSLPKMTNITLLSHL